MESAAVGQDDVTGALRGLKVGFAGRLAAMTHQSAHQLVREHGGTPVDRLDMDLDLLVVADDGLPFDWQAGEQIDERLTAAAERGELRITSETEFWRRLGLVEEQDEVRQLYTPAMLAELAGVPVGTVRRWQSRGLIVPVRQVHRLGFFDFREVQTARRLAELLGAGASPKSIEQKLAKWRSYLPQVERPLAQLAIIVHGKDLLLRSGDGLIEAGGQRRFDFESATAEMPSVANSTEAQTGSLAPGELVAMAEELEAQGDLTAACESYRAALSAGGPDAEICFRLAELLYRLGDAQAARERYYMALEIDEDYVEARANLGCVLLEQGQTDLAIAAFEGALACHQDYPDVHYQLARALDESGRPIEADEHWRAFLKLAPASPWAEVARARLRS